MRDYSVPSLCEKMPKFNMKIAPKIKYSIVLSDECHYFKQEPLLRDYNKLDTNSSHNNEDTIVKIIVVKGAGEILEEMIDLRYNLNFKHAKNNFTVFTFN